MKQKTIVPPDGGYGWVIVFSNALSNFIATPLMHCFGLIFNVTFINLGFSATQSSLIINLNAAFGMMTGLINGALLKVFGCRKVAILASFLLTVGVVLTSFSRTFTHFMISYGVITSLGMGLSQSAFGLAVNMYFVKRRSYAVGLSETITGFGPILIPQIISVLMASYSPAGVTLIFGGICANVFVGAVLLQPVEWHTKKQKNELKEQIEEETPSISTVQHTLESSEESKRLSKEEQIDSIDSESTFASLSLEVVEKKQADQINLSDERQKKQTFFQKVVTAFDLDLLKDGVFVNIMMGLALAIFAELNFTVLTPFMLHDYGLHTGEIAIFLSVLGGADIVFRFFAPYIGNFFTKPPRWMYAYSLFLLMITRFTFLLSRNFYVLIAIALGLGIAKGVRKVYMTLVIPDYVPIDKLATASGMEMMMNGFCIMIGGPILGIVRDVTGSYVLCVVIMNCVTFTTISMWLVEVLVVRFRTKRTVNELSV